MSVFQISIMSWNNLENIRENVSHMFQSFQIYGDIELKYCDNESWTIDSKIVDCLIDIHTLNDVFIVDVLQYHKVTLKKELKGRCILSSPLPYHDLQIYKLFEYISGIPNRCIVEKIAITKSESFIIFSDFDGKLFIFQNLKLKVLMDNLLVVDICAGYDHILILARNLKDSQLSVFSIGNNDFGQLGNGTTESNYESLNKLILPIIEIPSSIAATLFSSFVLMSSHGSIYQCGTLGFSKEIQTIPEKLVEMEGCGQLLSDGSATGIKLIRGCNHHFICVADQTNDVFGFGLNKFGQLGNNSMMKLFENFERIFSVDEEITETDFITAACCGMRHCLIVTNQRVLLLGNLGFANYFDVIGLQTSSSNDTNCIKPQVLYEISNESSLILCKSLDWYAVIVTKACC